MNEEVGLINSFAVDVGKISCKMDDDVMVHCDVRCMVEIISVISGEDDNGTVDDDEDNKLAVFATQVGNTEDGLSGKPG